MRGQEHTAQDFIHKALSERGYAIDRWAIDEAAIKDHPGLSPVTVSYANAINVVGSAAQAWKLLFFLDKCCRAQVKAMAAAHAAGEVLTIPSSEVVAQACVQSHGFVAHPCFVADWSSFLDQLEREDPSFRD